MKNTKEIEPIVGMDIRREYSDLLESWQGKDLSAQHRFIDIGDDSVLMSFNGNPVLQSIDEGKTWHKYPGPKTIPPCSHGIFRKGDEWVAISGGRHLWRSLDAGRTWGWGKTEKILSADDIHFQGLGIPNVFSNILTTKGNIISVADNFLGQEGPGGQLINSVTSFDFGHTWKVSRLFGPGEPLPNAPEGFGEPAVVELKSGLLWMVMRSLYGELWQCISHDQGMTWSVPTPTGLSSPIANCYAKRIPVSTATVLCFNLTKPGIDTSFTARRGFYRPRKNLVFMVSHDNCRTWTCPVVIDAEEAQYPTIHFTDKTMFIMYQKSQTEKTHWENMGLVLVTYDLKEVDSLPAWNTKTIQPYIDEGLIAHWLAIACTRAEWETIS